MSARDILDWLRTHVADGADLHLDSRRIRQGDVFVACPGTLADGRDHILAAVEAGAMAVVFEADGAADALAATLAGQGVPALAVPALRSALGAVAHAWYGEPSATLAVLAVTGTNGKTSCTQWLAQALSASGRPCGVIGTLGVSFPDGTSESTGLTTPDVIGTHRLLARLRAAGAQAVAIEASSIGLEQGRMDGVQIAVAAFTNLTRDHLDAHGDMVSYERAKARLFAWPGLQAAVINRDDAAGARMADVATAPVLGYRIVTAEGVPQDTALVAESVQATTDGTLFTLRMREEGAALIRTPLLGRHNVENLLAVAGVLRALGWPLQRVAGALGALTPVRGRLQSVGFPGSTGPLVVVDYAHTPDALANVLAALRPLADARRGRLVCLFGCGGERDPGKRGPMGAIVQAHADTVVVTSDNPRSESPDAIIAAILAGMLTPQADTVRVEPDRALAILGAVWRAQPADVVLLAGKGHETTQQIGATLLPFDDAEWARVALALARASAVTTDTRRVNTDEVFVALTGERFDGHDFVAAAADAGALAAIVEHPVTGDVPQLVVGDTRQALLRIGQAWRERFTLPLIAVTGSNGKTTTKEMVAAILAAWHGRDAVLATQGNLNNEIGVPLTLLRLRPGHRAAVVELGMNHPGEIAVLAAATRPTIALVNNAQREHQEFMQSVHAVAVENGAVLAALATDGVAVFPADDAHAAVWEELADTRARQRFAVSAPAEVVARDVIAQDDGTAFTLVAPQGEASVRLRVAGRHNLHNALAAAACTLAAGCPLSAVAEGLAGFSAVQGRLQSQRLADGTWLIDDTYNANPDSVRAAIDVLAGLPGPRVLVLGDMGEVGNEGPAMHREVGAYARERGIERLVAMGEASRACITAFGDGATHVADAAAAATLLRTMPAGAILVKGSRFMRMEKVVVALQQAQDSTGGGQNHAA
ncbi:bifunctional UDP-N-acetylmuramoyl-L-alanyl-D-glutamate--2,6-diaminopimelate ligase MurE/UDP-N-acetylmuramoyl-tripeptide--D-alanyl-D-alanine ligase MurF [Achromobacter sp. GG226]|uniref:bifunctional UDP-N-acetylmuramoyl-L-alanyl-D-glutamate--2, 6-diaminopimelate ligase MurE/UDP-N-acetylmuramoyl-tripeptide--D-alanyl-D-alanine ligase MurF n=1 Tax=Verticiella alkaliphila TaxID=2779529 RepID=UPI001C0DF955|nr:bifunctional UDP-N-acetylmuramoyl-L-alanyl-D-glutamate--2,6-diaminopimelate ligase MurE/UDP-N-acetylmuramoyl-tripeptide--D-alanyl-D-alanine ligase MurF [Verticiella sp. GG226]MBU4612069.1 bifunctional UDP-N-acetylmuramoyl-L-alanyl-D-glutamate--2,6-diaminopimelate ligase MurE/UDP-N-acetylmuramoyl-tripeptide--D-alanyl-D-alanine ligase MurF [Verticiella sp. GG226]